MSNRVITLILGIIIVILFGTYFFIRDILYDYDNVLENKVLEIRRSIDEGNWQQASILFDEFNKEWEKAKYLVIFNNAEEAHTDFTDAVTNLGSSIEIRDKSNAVQMITRIRRNWINYIKLVPEP